MMFLTGCGVTKPTPPTIVYRDSIKVEYRERIVHDTVAVRLPDILQERTTPDTLSVLENDYAKSTAVVHDGTLSHDLHVFPQLIRVPVYYPVHDTLVVREKGETVTEYVEVEKELTKWQSLKMRIGGYAMLALLIFAIVAAVREIIRRRK